ncbi:MAG: hypothetical protein HY791_11815 [Deltaproteobacteria bacterium]|nr:hypothetical protein [Deltaproteobacteria bacterium]
MPLERINLNVTTEMRRQIRAIAKRTRKTESEAARELLSMALEQTRRQQFYESVADGMTSEVRRHMIALARALEELDD